MERHLIFYRFLIFILFFPSLVSVAAATEALKGDNIHVRTWNKFAQDSLNLHEKLKGGKNLQVKSKIGSYPNLKNFYQEERYFENGRLVSQVQWEKDNPEQLHTIEVFIHDENGRVIRDFAAAYLPFYHNAPTQTLISFHQYNGNLHAFRSFDATGDKILERCTGKNSVGKTVNFILDEDDLYNDDEGIIGSADYISCFAGLKQQKLGKYIIPQ